MKKKVKFKLEIESTKNGYKFKVKPQNEDDIIKIFGQELNMHCLSKLIRGGSMDWIETFIENEVKMKLHEENHELQ